MIDEASTKYAIALLSVAKEENNLESYLNEAKDMRSVFLEEPNYLKLLASYHLSNEKKYELIDEVFNDYRSKPLINLLKLVTKNGRANKFIYVLDDFIHQAHLNLGIREGFIFSTYPLDDESMEKFNRFVFKKTGYKVSLQNRIDTRLIGGFKIVVGDKVLDLSLKAQLDEMKNKLVQGGKNHES